MITAEIIKSVTPKAKQPEGWANAIGKACDEFGIVDKHDVAMFLAQCAAESGELTRLEEDLNYSAARLMAVWPHFFPTMEEAKLCEYKPVSLAIKVYGGRYGNNTMADGYRYRGRGILQITFKYNYMVASSRLGMDLVSYPERMATQIVAARGAASFFTDHAVRGLSVADATRIINGGHNGLEARTAYYEKAMAAL